MAGKVTVVGAGFYGSTTAQRIAEYNIDEYSEGVALNTLKVSASGTGKVVQTGYECDINGIQLSIQKIEIQAKNGKLA